MANGYTVQRVVVVVGFFLLLFCFLSLYGMDFKWFSGGQSGTAHVPCPRHSESNIK